MCRGLAKSPPTMYICEINSDDECGDVSHMSSVEYGSYRTSERVPSPSFARNEATDARGGTSISSVTGRPPLRSFTSWGSLGDADWEGSRINRSQPYPRRELLHNKSQPLGTMETSEGLASPRDCERHQYYAASPASENAFQRRNSFSHSSEYDEQHPQQQHHAFASRPRSPMRQVPSWCSDDSDRQSSSTATSSASPQLHHSPTSSRAFHRASPPPPAARRVTRHSVDDILDATACEMRSSLVLADQPSTATLPGRGASPLLPALHEEPQQPQSQPHALPQQAHLWSAPVRTRTRAVSDSERRIRNIGSPNTPYHGGYGHRHQAAASRYAQPYHFNSPGSLPRSISRCASASLPDSGVERRHHPLKGCNSNGNNMSNYPHQQPLTMFLGVAEGSGEEEKRSLSPCASSSQRLDRLDSMHEVTSTLERTLIDAAKSGFSVPTIPTAHRSLFFEAFAGIL